MIQTVLIDIDNTLLSFDAYVKQTMKEGFEHFGLKPYEPYMFDIFIRENTKLWRQIEQGTLVFEELEKIRWNIIFKYLDIEFDGTVFEKYLNILKNSFTRIAQIAQRIFLRKNGIIDWKHGKKHLPRITFQ